MHGTQSLLARLMARIAFAPEDEGGSGVGTGAGGDGPPPPGNDGTPPPAGDGTPPPGGEGDPKPFAWFGDELAADEQQYLEAKSFKSPRDLFKSLRSAEKMIRGDHVAGPPEDAEKHGDWLKETGLAKRLGIPEEASGYEVTKPEFDESIAPFVKFDDDRQGKFLETAHKLNMTPAQVQGMLDLYAAETSGDVQAYVTEAQADEQRMQSDLKREWGEGYEQNLAAALEVAKESGLGEAQIETLRTAGVMGSVQLAKLLHEVAQFRGNDSLKGGGKGGGMQTREQATQAFDEFKAKNAKALTDRTHPEHDSAMARYRELMAAAGRGSQAQR
ncbi:hypothetical protein [Celeribacter sp.]|uniref:hypothetical protein n=1 Tax=Celeribacter sp. TaxID=1890673 RepID=UPI003A8F1A32